MAEDRKHKRERASDQPVECPDCGALFKDESKLGTHQFQAHEKDRRVKPESTTQPSPPAPKPKPEPKPEEQPKQRGWFSGRPS